MTGVVYVSIAPSIACVRMGRVFQGCRWRTVQVMDGILDQITVVNMITTEEIDTDEIVAAEADLPIVVVAEATETIMTITGTTLGIETDVTTTTTVAAQEAIVGIVTGEEKVAEKTHGRPEIVHESESDLGIYPGIGQGKETGIDLVGDREVDPVGDRGVGRGSDAIEETGIGTANVVVQVRSMALQRVMETQVSTREPLEVPVRMEPELLGLMDEWKSLENVAVEVVTGVGKVARRKGAHEAEVHLPVQKVLLENNVKNFIDFGGMS